MTDGAIGSRSLVGKGPIDRVFSDMSAIRARTSSSPSVLRWIALVGASVFWLAVWTQIGLVLSILALPRLVALPALALVCAFTLLAAYPIPALWRRSALRWLAALSVTFVTVNCGIQRSDEELLAQGEALVQSIEAHRREQGGLPATLDELDPPTWPSQYGWWGYRVDVSAQRYLLWLGSYALDGRSLYFESQHGDWQVNS